MEILARGKAHIRYRNYIPYDTVAVALKGGNDVFFEGPKRQTMYKAAHKLSRMLKDEVVAAPATNDQGKKGYVLIKKRPFVETNGD